ncbi:MAG: LON peptidase substrate-binding domain-containing protein [Gammaproteobacteria bacterium]|nr:LON peptidase substrate-binding domain-containing protein [Gammaproteobacteria bacterium]
MRVPLFPLRTVLFPDGPLPLRIFESRYLDMISDCVKSDSPFGVLLIREGQETGPAKTYDVGTLARITDWYQGSDGLLGVIAIGGQRFRLLATERLPNGLNVGEIELLPAEPTLSLRNEDRAMAGIVDAILRDLGRLYESLERNFDDAGWVTYRLLEILPIEMEEKQRCLEHGDPEQRLRLAHDLLDSIRRPRPGS